MASLNDEKSLPNAPGKEFSSTPQAIGGGGDMSFGIEKSIQVDAWERDKPKPFVAKIPVQPKSAMASTQMSEIKIVTSTSAREYPKDQPPETEETKPVSISELLQHATTKDMIMFYIALLAEGAAGAFSLIYLIWFGSAIDAMGVAAAGGGLDMNVMLRVLVSIFVSAGIVFAGDGIGTAFLTIIKENQLAKYKTEYLNAIARQDISWHDASHPEELATAYTDTMHALEQGLGKTSWVVVQC